MRLHVLLVLVLAMPIASADDLPFQVLYNDYPGPAPLERSIIVRGDADVVRVTIDVGMTGQNQTDVAQRDAELDYVFQTPGDVPVRVTAFLADNTSAGTVIHFTVENGNVAGSDPRTTDASCGRLCQHGSFVDGINHADIRFTPADLWKWIAWAALVSAAGLILFFRLIHGRAP